MRTATPIHTPIGPMLIVSEDDLPIKLTADLDQPLSPPGPRTRELIERLDQVLRGQRQRTLAPDEVSELLADRVSDFQLRALQLINEIGPGQVRTYAQLASDLGSPGASRAVGSACAANPLPLMIACHRVVPTGSGLGGYSGPGIEAKRALLAREGADLTGR